MQPPLPAPLRAVLFDLDGTLVDSGRDLAAAINRMLRDLGLGPLPTAEIIRYVGDGVLSLIARSIAAARGDDPWKNPTAAAAPAALPGFRAHYLAHLHDYTELLPGAAELLDLIGPHARIAVVTNKPEEPARGLVEALGIAPHLTTLLGGDSLPTKKPDPAMIYRALQDCDTDPANAILVGDGLTDAQAGRAAALFTVGLPSALGRYPERVQEAVDLFLPDLPALTALLRAHFAG
jgi:phosphoglycolate phosphatase